MIRNYTVYCHVSPCDKIYFGITGTTTKKRWNSGHGYCRNERFFEDIVKYGWDNFEHIIIKKDMMREDALSLEVELIKVYNSTNEDVGYNLTSGGTSYSHSQFTKDKLSELFSGKGNPMYGRRGKRGKDSHWFGTSGPMFGKEHSDETKDKISKSRLGKFNGDKNPSAVSVRCVTTGKEFGTLKEAGKYYSTAPCNISSACRGKIGSSGKLNGESLEWEYINGGLNC